MLHLATFGGVRVIVAAHPDGGRITLPESEFRATATRPDTLFDGGSIRKLLERVDAPSEK